MRHSCPWTTTRPLPNSAPGPATGSSGDPSPTWSFAYGRTEVLQELASRPTATGDLTHNRVSEEQSIIVDENRLGGDEPPRPA